MHETGPATVRDVPDLVLSSRSNLSGGMVINPQALSFWLRDSRSTPVSVPELRLSQEPTEGGNRRSYNLTDVGAPVSVGREIDDLHHGSGPRD